MGFLVGLYSILFSNVKIEKRISQRVPLDIVNSLRTFFYRKPPEATSDSPTTV